MRLTAKFDGGTREAQTAATTTATTTVRPRQENDGEPAPSPAARNLALAHHIERLIGRGVIADYTQAARMLGVSQPRMTHLMGLLLLAPAIQEAILLCETAPEDKELRGLARTAKWDAQESWVRAGVRRAT